MIADAPDCHVVRLARLEYEIEETKLDLQETASDLEVSHTDWAGLAALHGELLEWRLAILEEISE